MKHTIEWKGFGKPYAANNQIFVPLRLAIDGEEVSISILEMEAIALPGGLSISEKEIEKTRRDPHRPDLLKTEWACKSAQ